MRITIWRSIAALGALCALMLLIGVAAPQPAAPPVAIAKISLATSLPLPTAPPTATPANYPEVDRQTLLRSALIDIEQSLPVSAPLEPTPTPRKRMPHFWIEGSGPVMSGQLVAQTERIDFYVGKNTLSPEVIKKYAPAIEWALTVTEDRFGERLYRRVSMGFYRTKSRELRGIAYTDSGRMELYYLPNESTDRLVAVAAHELAHNLQAQRYGQGDQSMSDTILLEGAATWIAGDQWLRASGAQSWRERARQLDAAGVPLVLKNAQRYGANNAYELWASFVDYLLDTYGFPAYRQIYSSGRGRAQGSADYKGVTGKSLDELTADWKAWVRGS